MAHQINTGAAAAVPTFDPASWTTAWAAIGGGFARTTGGLFLSWDRVTDADERTRLHRQIVSDAATAALIDYLDARQTGRLA